MMVLRSMLVAARRLRRASRRETPRWVQMGSEFGHPFHDFVTFEDMTVSLAVDLPDYVQLRPPVAAAWIRRQKLIYRRARACCVASRWAADSIVEYGIDRSKVHVVGCGCNIRAEVGERDWSIPRFLFLGLDWKRKNGNAVVDAFAQIRRGIPDARLCLVGDHPLVDYPGVTCYGLLRKENSSERSRIEQLLRESTCLVLPSKYEPFGIVYAEAGWAGIPSIGTSIGGAADAIGAGGIIVDPHRPAQLVKAMTLLSQPETVRNLGAKARTHAELLTWDAVAHRVAGALGLADREPDLPYDPPIDGGSL